MLFASLILDRMPLYWGNLPDALSMWLQNAGGVAAVGIFLVMLIHYVQRDAVDQSIWNLPSGLKFLSDYFLYLFGAVVIAYLVVIVGWIGLWLEIRGAANFAPRQIPGTALTIGDWILTIAGTIALAIALTPMVVDFVTRISWGRIWAIARLSWKEAIRGRVIWVFGAMALVFLFADWFVPFKAEDQVRNYVRVVYWSMTPLFLITAALLGSFSIPNDVRNNSIHTIVTKPVEKYEIVLGRFLGYAALLTIGLFVVASVSLIYVIRGVNDEAKHESYKRACRFMATCISPAPRNRTRAKASGANGVIALTFKGRPNDSAARSNNMQFGTSPTCPPTSSNAMSRSFSNSRSIFSASPRGKKGKGYSARLPSRM